MQLIKNLLRRDRARNGERFEITSAAAFEGAVFSVRDETRDPSLMSSADLELQDGDHIVCVGKGGGGHPAFKVAAGEEWKNVVIGTSFKADGAPGTYGLQRLERGNLGEWKPAA